MAVKTRGCVEEERVEIATGWELRPDGGGLERVFAYSQSETLRLFLAQVEELFASGEVACAHPEVKLGDAWKAGFYMDVALRFPGPIKEAVINAVNQINELPAVRHSISPWRTKTDRQGERQGFR